MESMIERIVRCPPWFKAYAGLVMIACVGAATRAASGEQRTTRDMTSLSQPAANRAVRNDLLSILRPLSGRLSTGMRVRLGDVVLSTRPYGTKFPGLCQQDTLWLKYGPTDLTPKARDQPLQAYGVEGHAMFHPLRPPRPADEGPGFELRIWSEECDRLADDENANWFEAKDPSEAARAVSVLLAAVGEIRSNTLKPKSCTLFPNNHSGCVQTIIDEGDIHKIYGIGTCPSEEGFECYEIDSGDYTALTVVTRNGSDSAGAITVESVSVAQYIVVT